MNSDGNTIFSEQEAADLVLEAAKLQQAAPEGGDYTPGIRLEDLKRMAADLGVEEKYLMEALKSRRVYGQVGAGKGKTGFFGAEWSREYEAVLDGELPPEHFDIVAEELSGTAGAVDSAASVTKTIGRMIQGTVAKGMGHGTLTVAGRNGRTRIQLTSDASVPFLTGLFPMTIVGMLAGLLLADKGIVPIWAGWGIFLALTLVGFLVTQLCLGAGHATMEEVFRRVVEKVDAENSELRERLGRESVGVSSEEGVGLEDRLGDGVG